MTRQQQNCEHDFALISKDRSREVCEQCGKSRAWIDDCEMPIEQGERPWKARARREGPGFVREIDVLIRMVNAGLPGNIISQIIDKGVLTFALSDENQILKRRTEPKIWTP